MRKRFLSVLLILAMVLTLLPAAYADGAAFVDVPENAYYKEAVDWAVANGITNGTSPDKFSPNQTCTRGQVVTFLWRAKGSPAVSSDNPFTDVPQDAYYLTAVLWAAENGITSGTSADKFSPNRGCTRAQVVTFLWRTEKEPEPETTENPFVDVADSAYYYDAVLWAVENGITLGTSDTTFSPNNTCTRGQIVTFLFRALAGEGSETDERLNEYGLANEIEDGAILHAWCWNFNTIREMIPQIAAAGFSAVQTSPINSILVGENGGLQIVGSGKWYYHYQPTEYEEIGNYQLGTDEEFRQMCETAHQYGVKIIVDQVLNHLTATESAISDKIKNEIDWGEPGEWGDPDKPWTHKSTGLNWSERDRFEETQNSLSGLIEWNTQNPNVQQYILKWLKTCVEAGADGFRYDAAKLIELPDDVSIYHPDYQFASEYWPTVLQNGADFQYGEVLQEGEPNHRWQDVPGVVSGYDDEDSSRLHAYQDLTFTTKDGAEKHFNTTLSFYGWRLRDAVSKGNLDAAYVGDMLVPQGASADRTVTWVESHDNYINDRSYNELDEQQVIQAWAILAARKEGTPLFFSRPMNATASSPYGNNRIGPEGSHFFMDAQVVAVNFFRNEMGSAEEFISNPTGTEDLVMIERGDKGAVIVNIGSTDAVLSGAPVQSMADGSYIDQVYGGAFTVSGGKITGTVRAGKVAVVYNSELEGRLDFLPEIALSVPTSEFITDTLEVTVSMRGVDRAEYTLGDTAPAAVTDGSVITVGEGLQGDECVTLTVTGYNAENEKVAEASATYTKRIYRADTIVYVEDAVRANRGWGDATVYIYLWGSSGSNNGSWPGTAAVLQAEGEWAGYWKYVLPFELENEPEMHVIVNNGAGGGNNQIERNDMLIHPGEIKVMNADEEWIDGADAVKEPRVYMSPGDGATFKDSLDVTLYVIDCDSAKYQVDAGELIAFENGDVVTLGAELANNETVTLKLFGYDAEGTEISAASATYTKRIYNGDTTIYINPAVRPDWTNFCIYVYPDNGHGWPGVQQADMVMENGLWVWVLPEDLQYTTLTVIFSNGGANQVEQGWTIGPDEHKLWTISGSSTNGQWIDYVPDAPVDLSALEDAIAAAEAVNPENYTAESAAALAAALEAAKTVAAKEDPTPEEIETALNNLYAAMAALVPVTPPYQGITTIYVDPAVKPEWSEFAVYIWGDASNGTWPGVLLSEKNAEGFYVYRLADELQGLETLHVIFNNNGGGEQVEYYEGGSTRIDIKPDEQLIWRPDGEGGWEFVPYTPKTIIYVAQGYLDANGWSSVSAHVYNLSGISTAWPGVQGVKQTEGPWTGYWMCELPADFKGIDDIRVILSDNGSSQVDVGGSGDADMAWGEIKVMTADGLWINAAEISSANVFLDPADGTEFYTETLDVTLRAPNCAAASYQVNDAAPVAFEDGFVLSIGAEAKDGEQITVKLVGTNAVGEEVTASAVYTKHFNEGVPSVKVLFIGNSFTYYNEIWSVFQKIVYSAGRNADVDAVYEGSYRLYMFADPNDPKGAIVEQKLAEQDYDIVFLQEQSTDPLTNYNSFLNGATSLYNKIKADNADTRVILYQTWARKTGSDTLTSHGWTNESMTHDLEQAYARVGEALGVDVSPAGTAFFDVYSHHGSSIELYDADLQHPSAVGTYLAALVHAQTALGIDPLTVPFNNGNSEATAQILKQAAHDAPLTLQTPQVYLTPYDEAGVIFKGESIELTLSAVNVAKATCQIGEAAAVEYANGAVVNVGAELEPGQSVTVTLKGYNEAGDEVATSTCSYTKKQVVQHFMVIGWYVPGTTDTGLNEENVAAFAEALKSYLATQGATEAQLADIILRPYEGLVADIGAKINADGDVDILIGVGNNIDTTGGVPILEKVGGIAIGTRNRYIARLTDREMVKTAYDWIAATYAA